MAATSRLSTDFSMCTSYAGKEQALSRKSGVCFMFLFQYEEYFTSTNILNKYGMEGNISTQGLQAKTYSPIYLTLKFFHLVTLIKNELNRVRFGINLNYFVLNTDAERLHDSTT